MMTQVPMTSTIQGSAHLVQSTKKNEHKLVGATVRATNRTYGLAPSRAWGEPETVKQVVCEYDSTIETVEGNTYLNGDYTIIRYKASQ